MSPARLLFMAGSMEAARSFDGIETHEATAQPLTPEGEVRMTTAHEQFQQAEAATEAEHEAASRAADQMLANLDDSTAGQIFESLTGQTLSEGKRTTGSAFSAHTLESIQTIADRITDPVGTVENVWQAIRHPVDSYHAVQAAYATEWDNAPNVYTKAAVAWRGAMDFVIGPKGLSAITKAGARLAGLERAAERGGTASTAVSTLDQLGETLPALSETAIAAQRISFAADLLQLTLTPRQSTAIVEAHDYGTPTEDGYAVPDLLSKARILRDAGFDEVQTRQLMEAGVVGKKPENALPQHFERAERAGFYELQDALNTQLQSINSLDVTDMRPERVQEFTEVLAGNLEATQQWLEQFEKGTLTPEELARLGASDNAEAIQLARLIRRNATKQLFTFMKKVRPRNHELDPGIVRRVYELSKVFYNRSNLNQDGLK